MDFVETEGDTIEAAIENAVRLLGAQRDKITVEVLSQGRKGILGFGSQKARIRAELRRPAVARPLPPAKTSVEEEPESSEAAVAPAIDEVVEKARATLEDILRLMGIRAIVERKTSTQRDEAILEVRTENSGLLIGRKGQTLEALQYLVNRIAGEHHAGEGAHVVVDVEHYRERRRRSLEDMALRLGEKAKRQRKTVTVDALSSADRRVIHAALQDDPWLSTRSLGQGAYRRLLIVPQGDRKTREDAPARNAGGRATATTDKPAAPTEAAEIDEDH